MLIGGFRGSRVAPGGGRHARKTGQHRSQGAGNETYGGFPGDAPAQKDKDDTDKND